jgi:hypothetical protein
MRTGESELPMPLMYFRGTQTSSSFAALTTRISDHVSRASVHSFCSTLRMAG